jgi:hypothetical protein
MLLRLSLHKWQDKLASRQRLDRIAIVFHDTRCLKTYFDHWQTGLDKKKKVKWREEMRRKLKILQGKRHAHLKKEAWHTWREAYMVRFASQNYERNLLSRMIGIWRKRLSNTFLLEDAADEFRASKRSNNMDRFFREWHRATQLRSIEKVMSHRAQLRMLSMVWERWRNQMCVSCHENRLPHPNFDFFLEPFIKLQKVFVMYTDLNMF